MFDADMHNDGHDDLGTIPATLRCPFHKGGYAVNAVLNASISERNNDHHEQAPRHTPANATESGCECSTLTRLSPIPDHPEQMLCLTFSCVHVCLCCYFCSTETCEETGDICLPAATSIRKPGLRLAVSSTTLSATLPDDTGEKDPGRRCDKAYSKSLRT